MATFDPSIAMGYRPIQVENPVNLLAKGQELQLNAAKMNEYQRGLEEQNALRQLVKEGLDPNTPDFAKRAYQVSPELGIKVAKSQAELNKNKYEAMKLEGDVVKQKLDQSRSLLEGISTPDQYLAWHEANHRDPVLGPLLASRGITADQSRARIIEALKQPGGLDRLIMESKLGAEKFQSDLTTRRGQDLTYSAATQPVFSETAGGFFSRPTAGKESTFIPAGNMGETTKGKAVSEAKQGVTDLAANMAEGYQFLKDKKAIKSVEAGKFSNLARSTQSGTVGQLVGSAFGTEEQDTRDFIISQRPLLIQAIVKASGMSAQQINSNAELKNLIAAATDPSKGYESNVRSLRELNKRYGTGATIFKTPPAGAETPKANAPAGKPSLDDIFK